MKKISYNKFDELLKQRNLKAVDVARGIGIYSGKLSDWKAGRYTPKLDKLQQIADFLNVPVSYFFDDTKTLENSLPTTEVVRLKTISASLDATTKEILTNLDKLSDEQKNAILALIKSFAK